MLNTSAIHQFQFFLAWLVILVLNFVSELIGQENKTDALSSTGGRISSSNFETVFILGQSSPPHTTQSDNFIEIGGFLGQVSEYVTSTDTVEWTVPLTISLDDDGQDVISFGTHSGATDGLDLEIDVLNPPSAPGSFDAYFQINHPTFPNLSEDYRLEIPNSWTMIITASNGGNGTITWNASDFPAGYELKIKNDLTILADMLCVDSLDFTGDQNLTIEASISTPMQPLLFRLERTTGNVYAEGCFIPGSADLAEYINVSDQVEPGDIVELDPTNPGHYRKARGASNLIAGIITTDPGFTLGNNLEKLKPEMDVASVNALPSLALLGRVPVKANIENGPIQPGDLLTVSSKPGFAARCNKPTECRGTIIGKALQSLETGEGKILVLVMAR